VIQFGFPTQFVTPFIFNYLFHKWPTGVLIGCRLGQLASISLMIYSFYMQNYWCYVLSRVLHQTFLFGNKICSSNFAAILEILYSKEMGKWKYFISEMSEMDVSNVVVSAGIFKDLGFDFFKNSIVLFPSWLCFGLSVIS
jgi:hypothetical protein